MQQDPYEFEMYIYWTLPLSDLKGVRISEKVVIASTRAERPDTDYDIVAYSILGHRSPNSGIKGQYLRRVFIRDAQGYLLEGVFPGIRLERDSLI
jgi:hypothetical protein